MSSLRRNVVANVIGVVSTAAVQLLCVPFYVRAMGLESYGLVGFFLTLQAALTVLDLGLTATVSRELARSQPGDAAGQRSFVRTAEVFSWSVGLVLGALVVALAPLIAERWVNASGVPLERVTGSVRLMGVLLAVQWPIPFYSAGLQGLERQVPLNALRVVMSALGGVGAIAALELIAPRVEVFFAWQLGVGALHVAVGAGLLWRFLPPSPGRARVELARVRPALGFAAGMGALTFFGVLLTQMDKLVLSQLVPLAEFGHYMLAWTAANGLQLFIRPVFNGVFPRLSSVVARGDEAQARALYHQASQALAALVMPAAAVLALFPEQVLWVWTGDASIAQAGAGLVLALTVGTALNGMMHVPYALQLAHGWTRIGVLITVAMVATLLPLLVVLVPRVGASAAAWTWAGLNAAYVVVGLPWTHTRLLRGEAGRWLVRDVAPPFFAAAGVVLLGRLVAPASGSRLAVAGFLVATGLVAQLASAASAFALSSRASAEAKP